MKKNRKQLEIQNFPTATNIKNLCELSLHIKQVQTVKSYNV